MAQCRLDIPAGAAQLPVETIGYAGTIFHPVIPGKTVEREEVGIFQVNRAGIFIRDVDIADGRGGDQLDARREYLLPAKEFANEGPFHINRAQCNTARLPAGVTAIQHRVGQFVLAGMIDIAAHQPGQCDDLTHAGNAPMIPLRASKGALRILPILAQYGEGIGLQTDIPAQQRIIKAISVINCGQGNRNLPLILIQPQRLRSPACQREIGIAVNPLQIQHGAQPVIPADVITAQESAVAGAADGTRQAPFRGELELAIGKNISAKISLAHRIVCIEIGNTAAVGEVAGDLIRALFMQMAILARQHGRRFGIDMGGQLQILIISEPQIITA